MGPESAITIPVTLPAAYIEEQLQRLVDARVSAYLATLPTPDPLLPVKQVAEELGIHPESVTALFRLPADSPRRLHYVPANEADSIPQGRKVRRSQLQAWLDRNSTENRAAPAAPKRPGRARGAGRLSTETAPAR